HRDRPADAAAPLHFGAPRGGAHAATIAATAAGQVAIPEFREEDGLAGSRCEDRSALEPAAGSGRRPRGDGGLDRVATRGGAAGPARQSARVPGFRTLR